MADVMGVFYERVKRRVSDGLESYRRELGVIAGQAAKSGGVVSGNHQRQRLDAFRSATIKVTDECFAEVAKLPGTQEIHRVELRPFLQVQLGNFIDQAKANVPIPKMPPRLQGLIDDETAKARAALQSDLDSFEVGMWETRQEKREAAAPTHNSVHIYNSQVGAIQQAGTASTQAASGQTVNAQQITDALDRFAEALAAADVSNEIREAVQVEIDTIRPQLKKATPSTTIVHSALHSIGRILEGTTAGVLAGYFTALLIASGAH